MVQILYPILIRVPDILVGINVCFICVTLHSNSRFRIISCVIFSLLFKLVIFFGTLRLLPATKLFPLLLYTTPNNKKWNSIFFFLWTIWNFVLRKVHLGPLEFFWGLGCLGFSQLYNNNMSRDRRKRSGWQGPINTINPLLVHSNTVVLPLWLHYHEYCAVMKYTLFFQ